MPPSLQGHFIPAYGGKPAVFRQSVPGNLPVGPLQATLVPSPYCASVATPQAVAGRKISVYPLERAQSRLSPAPDTAVMRPQNGNSCNRSRGHGSSRRHPANSAPPGEEILPTTVVLPNVSSVELRWSVLPAEAHRARYENELSKRGNCRGAIEGRTSDYPSVKIQGLEKLASAPAEVNITIYVCMPDGRPHPFFYCKTAGRDAPATCQSAQLKDGTHVLRQVVKATNGYSCELRHVGIVRLRQGQDLSGGEGGPSGGNRGAMPSQANFFRLCVVTELASADGQQLSVISEPIKCISSTQSVLKPKISQVVKTGTLSESGRAEVYIFGKDFTPNTKFRVFQKLPDGRVWEEIIDDDNCTWVCTHHCCAKVRLPLPPSELGPEGESVKVKVEGVPHSARRSAASVALNWAEASTLEYPAEAPRTPFTPTKKPSSGDAVATPLATKRRADDEITLDDVTNGWTPGKAKSPRPSPLSSPPDSPSPPVEVFTATASTIQPTTNFSAPTTQTPFAFSSIITQLDSFVQPPAPLPLNSFPSFSTNTFIPPVSTLTSDTWPMPHTQPTTKPLQTSTIASIFDDLSASESPGSTSDFSSSCGSPYQEIFTTSEDYLPELGSVLESYSFLDTEDINTFSNQVATTLPQ